MAAGETAKIQVPSWARNFVSDEEAQRIAEAVAQAERQTSGEIVPIIVQRSSTIGHIPLTLTLLLFLGLLVFELPYLVSWGMSTSAWLLGGIGIVCFLISIPLAKFKWVQRLLVPQGDQAFQTEERALLEFYQAGIHQTRGRTGILIFISLMERKAVVLADEGISKKLPNETWEGLCQNLVSAIKSGKTVEGMVQAIERSGELLAKQFPGSHENENELSNLLILKQ